MHLSPQDDRSVSLRRNVHRCADGADGIGDARGSGADVLVCAHSPRFTNEPNERAAKRTALDVAAAAGHWKRPPSHIDTHQRPFAVDVLRFRSGMIAGVRYVHTNLIAQDW